MQLCKQGFLILLLLIFSNTAQSQGNYCLDFDGNNDFVSMSDVNDLGTNDFTLEAWVNIEVMDPGGSKIISKGLTTVGTPSNAGYGLRVNKVDIGDVEFHMGNSDGSHIQVVYNGITPNGWNHVAGVREGKKLYLYLNGELVQEDSTQTVYNVNTNIPLAVGAHYRGVFGNIGEYFNGKIDEVRIWSIKRTQAEIQENMNCAFTMPYPGLQAVYNLNDSMGTETTDSSGFGNNGNFFGAPQWVESDVAPVCSITSTHSTETKKLTIYPNPTHSEVTLSQYFNGSAFELFDVSGKMVFSGIIYGNRIDLAHLTDGIYYLKILDKEDHYLGKIIKI